MGKGDIKTAKGKRVRGSYGIVRPRKKNKSQQDKQALTSSQSSK